MLLFNSWVSPRQLIWLSLAVGALTPATAQTIQLPTIHRFGYSGSVLVPDGGTSSLGSYNSASQSGSQSGWLVPRWDTRSASVNSAGASITASIIDHEQMDRELLGQSAAELRNELRRQSPRPKPTMQAIEEGKSLVRYARTLVKQGRYRAARQAYLTALPLLDQRLRELALQEMNRLPSAS